MTPPLSELTLEQEAAAEQDALAASRPFAQSNDWVATWQVASTIALIVGVWVLGGWYAPWAAVPALGLLAAGLMVRLFVLQHDCGHLSLYGRRALNDGVGQLLGCISGIAYHTWRSEHNWHHAHQGKLSHRGVDTMNSPMTRAEAIDDPARAQVVARTITPLNVSFLGAVSILGLRKHQNEFFQFRKTFRWPVPDRDRLIKSIRWTNAGHLVVHAGVLAAIGPARWAALYLAPMAVAGLIGSWLFWVQHNFEATYHADDATWRFVDAGIQGASYLRLPGILAWFTGHIGLHHVHHLNPRIPNYRLEAARAAIPALATAAPLTREDLRRSFTHVFWDEDTRRMVPLPDEAR